MTDEPLGGPNAETAAPHLHHLHTCVVTQHIRAHRTYLQLAEPVLSEDLQEAVSISVSDSMNLVFETEIQ